MAFRFPFSTLHELNLDWILEKVKYLIENNEEFNNKADYAVETADEAKQIAEQAILPDGAVTTPKIADYAVTQVKLAVNAVGNYQLQDSSVTNGKIYDGAVTAAKIDDGAVTAAKIDDGAITAAKTSFFNNGVLHNIPYGNTTNLYDEGVVNSDGYYFISLMSVTTTADAGSAYMIRVYNSLTTFVVSPIYEGQYSAAPRIIQGTGVIDLNSSGSDRDIVYCVFKLN